LRCKLQSDIVLRGIFPHAQFNAKGVLATVFRWGEAHAIPAPMYAVHDRQKAERKGSMQNKAGVDSYGWLYAGIISTGVVIGYMVGASRSSVVGTAIPGVFTVLVFGFEALSSFKHSTATRKHEPEQSQPPATPTLFTPIGKILTLFSIAYFASMLLGTEVRAYVLRGKETEFPWPKSAQPANVEDALDWITVQSHLKEYGYSSEQIKQLYQLPRKNTNEQLAGYIDPSNKTLQTGPAGLHVEATPLPWDTKPLLLGAHWSQVRNYHVIDSADGVMSGDSNKSTSPKK
jgi:hypothetical protein